MGFFDKQLIPVKREFWWEHPSSPSNGILAGFLSCIEVPVVAAGAAALGLSPSTIVQAGFGVAALATAATVLSVYNENADLGDFHARAHGITLGSAVAAFGAAFASNATGLSVVSGAIAANPFIFSAAYAKERGYGFRRFLFGEVVGCTLGAALVFNAVAAAKPLQEQLKSLVVGAVPSTIHIDESRGGKLRKNFNVEQTADEQGRTVYILPAAKHTVPATVPA